MGKVKKQQSDVLGKISAINTLLERYPTLTTTDSMLTNFSINTSIGFLLSLLELFGVSQADIINWICSLLGDEDDGLLTGIEYTIKGILMANIKGVFSCEFNPILPDYLMKYAINDGGRQDPCSDFPYDPEKKNHIEINLQTIDLFGLLANCPSNNKGGVFYFDAFDPSKKEIIDGKEYETPNYIPSELYKSKDFNAFLWYVINKGNIGSGSDLQKNTWDNRNKACRLYDKYQTNGSNENPAKEKFFDTVSDAYSNRPRVPIIVSNQHVCDKEQYIICQYVERGSNQAYSNMLNVWLNADRYYRTRKFKVPVAWDADKKPTEWHEVAINKTAYEFNYDYIYSLKLFDTKTLVANIVNSLLGLASSISASFSLEQKQIQKQVELMVENIMKEDDTEVSDDCYYKFDNTTYQQLIDEVTKSYTGSYINKASNYTENYDDVYDALNSLGSATEKAGQSELLKRVIEATAYKAQGTSGITGGVEIAANWKIGTDFITDFVKQTVVQIVLQILSPKIGMLFAINAQLMGGVDDITDWKNFMQNFDNFMRNIITSVKDMIVKELYNFVMKQLQPLLELLIAKLALETVKYYKELILNLIRNCIPMIRFGGAGANTTIDNVNYADIVVNSNGETEQTTPTLPC